MPHGTVSAPDDEGRIDGLQRPRPGGTACVTRRVIVHPRAGRGARARRDRHGHRSTAGAPGLRVVVHPMVSRNPFELLTVATVDGRRGVEMHPERCHRQRRPGRGLLRRGPMAREPELHAGRAHGVAPWVIPMVVPAVLLFCRSSAVEKSSRRVTAGMKSDPPASATIGPRAVFCGKRTVDKCEISPNTS